MSKVNLDEAAKKCVTSIIYEHGRYDGDFLIPICEDIFKDGWNACMEQMMKETIEGEARPDDYEIWVDLVGHGYKFNDGEKIKIIIVKDD